MSELAKLLSEKPTSATRGGFAGWKLKLTFRSQTATVSAELRYAKVEAEPLIDLESEVKRVSDSFKPVKERWRKVVVEVDESGVEREISESQVRYVQEQNGQLVEVEKLSRTGEVDVEELRRVEECTLDDRRSVGVVMPVEEVQEYLPESTYEVWGEDGGAKLLAEILERDRLALLFPFTFGSGFKIYTAVMYPIRLNGNLHLVMTMNLGRRVLNHPLTASASAAKKPKPMLAKPMLKVKK